MAKPQKTFDIAAPGTPAKSRGPLWVIAVMVALVAFALFAWLRSRQADPAAPRDAAVQAADAADSSGSEAAAAPATPLTAPAPAESPATASPSIRTEATAHFAFGQADVDAAELEAFAAGAAEGGGIVTIAGHTDDIGDEGVNQILSDARAQAVETWLKSRGLPSGVEVRTRGFGESQPICIDATVDCRAKNRRAELVLERR